jgi:hypothetical protein
MKKMLFRDRMHSNAIVTQQNRPGVDISSTTFYQFTLHFSDPNPLFLHDLKKRSYLLNRLSERSDSAAKRKKIKSLVGMAILCHHLLPRGADPLTR